METFFTRYRNVSILVVVLFAQMIGLAAQVRRPVEGRSVRLVRVWAVAVISPFEKAVVGVEDFVGGFWHNYMWLRGVRRQNAELREQIESMRLQEIRLSQDAAQARRLQSLLAFKEQFISKTVAAQVIGTSGSEQSRTIYIDKGSDDGIKPDMAVITPDGIVGKVLKTFPGLSPRTSQVLLITDLSSGVGAILNKSRLQGILKGTASGEIVLHYVMSDERVESGEPVLTSGAERIFPKGMPIGTVAQVSTGTDLFLNIRVKPAAPLGKLEEVLVITKIEEKAPQPGDVAAAPVRASDILAERLPSLPPPKPADAKAAGATASTAVPPGGTTNSAKKSADTRPSAAKKSTPKPASEAPVKKAQGTTATEQPAAAPPSQQSSPPATKPAEPPAGVTPPPDVASRKVSLSETSSHETYLSRDRAAHVATNHGKEVVR
jgi:rod shape-determining protein MreC